MNYRGKNFEQKDITPAEREEIKKFAKDLYLEATADGEHKYSLQQISDKIYEVYGVQYSRISIFDWAKKGRWKDIFEAGVKIGEQRALDTLKEKYDVDLENFKHEIIDDEVYKAKIAQIKRAVIMQQAQVVRKMKNYIDSLPDSSSKIPHAGKSFSDANRILFEMLEKSPYGGTQRVSMNISIINPENVNVESNNG